VRVTTLQKLLRLVLLLVAPEQLPLLLWLAQLQA